LCFPYHFFKMSEFAPFFPCNFRTSHILFAPWIFTTALISFLILRRTTAPRIDLWSSDSAFCSWALVRMWEASSAMTSLAKL